MRRLLAPIAALTMLAVAACGGGDSGGTTSGASASGSGAPARLKVGVVPVVDTAPIWLGEKHGLFAKHNIELELVKTSGGAAAVPGVVSGDFQLAFGNVTSIVLAGSQKLPLRIIAEGNSSTGDPATDFSGVVVPGDSAIQGAKDLAGKTVAINNLKNIGEVTIRNAVEQAGGDPKSVTFVELDFPDMPAAVAGKRVDAAWVVEPFLTAATAQGARNVLANFTTIPDLTVATYFTSEQYLQQNRPVVDDFRAAIKESLQYAQNHPDEVRQIVTTYTTIKEDVASKIKLPAFPQDPDVDSIATVADLMQKYGITPSKVDVQPLLATG